MKRLSVIDTVIALFSVFLIINGIVLLLGGFFNPGDFVIYFMSIPSLFVLLPSRITGIRIKRICRRAVSILLILTAVYTAFLYGACIALRPDGSERIGIVLGASLVNDVPGDELSLRCDAGYDWVSLDDGRILVTSGGRGEHDNISQGEAMKDYIVHKGTAAERILAEKKSVNTEQNMALSLEVLKKAGYSPSDGIVIISGGFHIFRAWAYARWAGFENISAYPSRVRMFALLPDMYREAMATVKLILRLTGVLRPAQVQN